MFLKTLKTVRHYLPLRSSDSLPAMESKSSNCPVVKRILLGYSSLLNQVIGE